MLAKGIRSVPRWDRSSGQDATRTETFQETGGLDLHPDGITGVVFKANDPSRALEVVQRVCLARRRSISVMIEADGNPILRELDEVLFIAFDHVELGLHGNLLRVAAAPERGFEPVLADDYQNTCRFVSPAEIPTDQRRSLRSDRIHRRENHVGYVSSLFALHEPKMGYIQAEK
jgi:hypothetical protein